MFSLNGLREGNAADEVHSENQRDEVVSDGTQNQKLGRYLDEPKRIPHPGLGTGCFLPVIWSGVHGPQSPWRLLSSHCDQLPIHSRE